MTEGEAVLRIALVLCDRYPIQATAAVDFAMGLLADIEGGADDDPRSMGWVDDRGRP